MTPRIVYVGGAGGDRDAVVAALAEAGFEVESVGTVAAARERFDRADAVVTDGSLPDGDALDVCTAPTAPVVVYDADPDAAFASALLDAGASDYVLREETEPAALAERVRDATEASDESRYRQLIEALGDAVYVIDADGHFTTLNDALVAVSGYTREEALGEHVSLMMTDEDVERGEEAIGRLLAGDADTATFEMDLHTADGDVRRVENHIALLPRRDGEFRGSVGVLRDVTDRRRRDERLRELHDATRELFAAPDRETVAESAIEAAADILDYPINGIRFVEGDRLVPVAVSERTVELIGERPVYSLDDDDAPVVEAFRSGGPVEVSDLSRVGDAVDRSPIQSGLYLPLGEFGTLSIGTVSADAFDDTDRMLAGVLAANVTAALDRLARRAESAAERDRLAALFENIPDPAIYVEYEEGEPIVRDANPAFEATFGYDREALVGESVDEYVVPPAASEEATDYNDAITSGESVHGEVERLTADGPREFLLHVVPYEIGERTTRGFAIYTDITERKERERELERQNERLDQFAAAVSHDLRNPMNIVAGRLELARETGEAEHFEAAERALGRMEALVDGLLALARQGRMVGDPEPVALADAVRGAWASVETAGGTLDIGDLPTVAADGTRLGQLFENLFRNSMEHGGANVAVGPLADGGFYVADDGPGIPPDEREAVFEFGYSEGGGTGFGLAIVRAVAEAHGWQVSVTESETGGARFEFVGVEAI